MADAPSEEADQPSVIDRVRQLNGVTWEWKDPSYVGDDRPRAIGLIAQDVQAVFPEAVRTNADGYLMVDYAGVVGVLVEAVKELADRVDELEQREPAGVKSQHAVDRDGNQRTRAGQPEA